MWISVSDLDDEECLIVYKKLSLDQKRAALVPFRGEEAQVYTDPALVRDILEKYVLPITENTLTKAQVDTPISKRFIEYQCVENGWIPVGGNTLTL